MSRLNQIEPDPGSNLYRNIYIAIIISSAIIIWYYFPCNISDAEIGEIVQGFDANGEVDLVTLSEPNRPPERFETSPPQAKLLKDLKSNSKTCYIKAQIVNGVIPLINDRKIVSFEFKDCR